MKKVKNFFLRDKYLKLLTGGSKYITVSEFDVAVTTNQNVYIKIPEHFDSLQPEKLREKTDNVVNYLDQEGFLPKMERDKRVHVWVYN
ncbi:hypothetical protein KAR91_25235 [Candidatus Pacearchaeota archaeon]|nr:hypothetical protein [Candidatus Pacearchaeota archaeon]